MQFHKATCISIIAERLIKDGIIEVLHEEGATGYSFYRGGGEGSHGLHHVHRPSVVDQFSIVKIEAIMADRTAAENAAEKIAERFFTDQAGVIYMNEVDIMRPEKF